MNTFLLTGAPGVGKSTIASMLQRRWPRRFEVVPFGRLLYTACKSRMNQDFTYEEFKKSSASYVTQPDIIAASGRLQYMIRHQRNSRWLIVDSHAVAREQYGYRATPDDPVTLKKFAYSYIIQLTADPKVIAQRVVSEPARVQLTSGQVGSLQLIQMSISIYYAGTLGCPLHLVDAEGPVHNTVDRVEQLCRL